MYKIIIEDLSNETVLPEYCRHIRKILGMDDLPIVIGKGKITIENLGEGETRNILSGLSGHYDNVTVREYTPPISKPDFID